MTPNVRITPRRTSLNTHFGQHNTPMQSPYLRNFNTFTRVQNRNISDINHAFLARSTEEFASTSNFSANTCAMQRQVNRLRNSNRTPRQKHSSRNVDQMSSHPSNRRNSSGCMTPDSDGEKQRVYVTPRRESSRFQGLEPPTSVRASTRRHRMLQLVPSSSHATSHTKHSPSLDLFSGDDFFA